MLGEAVEGSVNVGVDGTVVGIDGIDNFLGFLGGGGVVQVGQIGVGGQEGEAVPKAVGEGRGGGRLRGGRQGRGPPGGLWG